MKDQNGLGRITTATSLVGLALGFFLLGFLILSKRDSAGPQISGGVVALLVGAAFLILALSYWRNEALKS
jgi:multisubunit Na+/H+ antiporter MnhB subunit